MMNLNIKDFVQFLYGHLATFWTLLL